MCGHKQIVIWEISKITVVDSNDVVNHWMYVCIYLFTRHGYTKVYSDNENNCQFG